MRDLIVVGGGPAGLSAAIFAAQQGLRAIVLERRRYPIDKACGEGIMPAGVAALERMGVRPRKGLAFSGIRYVDEMGAAEARFAEGTGLGIRRTELSSAMLERARALGVEIREGVVAGMPVLERRRVAVGIGKETLEACFLVAADGLRSPIRRRTGNEKTRRRRSRAARFGFRRHYRVSPWSELVEVHWTEGSEAYVTPVAEDEVGVAFLWHRSAPSYDSMLSRFPELERKLARASATSPIRGAGPFRAGAGRVVSGRLAFLGDAAGYVDAITGEGLALGFLSAEALVDSIRAGGLDAYADSHRRLFGRYRWSTELVLLLADYPGLRRLVIGGLSRRPEVFDRLLQVTHGWQMAPTMSTP